LFIIRRNRSWGVSGAAACGLAGDDLGAAVEAEAGSLLSLAMAEDEGRGSRSLTDWPETEGVTALAAGSLCKASRIRREGNGTASCEGDDVGAVLSPAVPSIPNSVMYSIVEVVPLPELFLFLPR